MTNLHLPSVVAAFSMAVIAQAFVYARICKDERFVALDPKGRRKALIVFAGTSIGLVALMTAFGAWSAFLR